MQCCPFSRSGSVFYTALALAVVLSASLIAQPSAPVYYVATNGSDGIGDGSAAAPWATITKAVQSVPLTGGTIVVRDGLYRGQTKISRKFTGLLVVRAEHPYRALLRNAEFQALSIWDAANVVVTGFDVARANPGSTNPLCAQIARSESVALIDNLIHDSSYNDLLKINEAPRNLLIMGNIFYNQQGSAGQHMDVNGAVEVTIRDNIFFNHTAGTGVNGLDTHGFIVVKNSGSEPESRRIQITSNVFLNYEGNLGSNFVLVGEDGFAFHEAQDVVVENNLMLGNSAVRMRAPLGVKGGRDISFRNNTISGDLPASAYALRMNREGSNPQNRSIYFFNNIWSDPTGTMSNFSDGFRNDSVDVRLENNLYWNGGSAIALGQSFAYTDDPRAMVGDPKLPAATDIVLPEWTGERFPSGAVTIREEFERLVRLYGVPAAGSAAIDRGEPGTTPLRDILDRARGAQPDLGAVEAGAAPAGSLRIVAVPEEVVGGAVTMLNQVVLNRPGAGEQVRLLSSHPAVVALPEWVDIPAGTSSGTFRLETSAVEVATPVRLTALVGSVTAETTITVLPAGLRSVNLGTDTFVAGNGGARNLVFYNGTAGPDGLTVTLTSSRPELVGVPATVAIAAGKSYSEYFPVTTYATAATTVVRITATVGASSASAEVTVTPAPFAVVAPYMIGESNADGQVTLDRAAPAGGAVVALLSSDPSVMSVPETVVVPAGLNLASFTVRAGAVDVPRAPATITASYDGRTTSVSRWVDPMVPYGVYPPAAAVPGVDTSVGFKVIARPAEDLTLDLIVPPGAPLDAPATVVAPAGTWGGTFTVRARPVTEPTVVRLTLSYRGRTRSADLLIRPAQLRTMYLTTWIVGGNSSYFTIVLEGPAPEGGAVVSLTSSNPGLLPLPESVTVPAGSTSAPGPLKPAVVTERAEVTISAVYGRSHSASTVVYPAALRSVTAKSSLTGSGTFSGNWVQLTGPAPAGGVVVNLASSRPEIRVPATVTVAPGNLTASFDIQAAAVAEAASVTITASAGDVIKTSVVNVQPSFGLTSIVGPAALVSGQAGTVTVKLVGSAPENGVTVSLSSSRPDLIAVPETVRIPGGSTSAAFEIAAGPVSSATGVTITAVALGTTKTLALSVTPPGILRNRPGFRVTGGRNDE